MILIGSRHHHHQGHYVGRPHALGNPYSHLEADTRAIYKVATREESVKSYNDWLHENYRSNPTIKDALHSLAYSYGQHGAMTLVCWCSPDMCHCDILANWIYHLSNNMRQFHGELFNSIGRTDVVCITTNGATKRTGAGVCGAGCAKQAVQRWPGFAMSLGSHIKNYGNTPGPIISENGTLVYSFPVKHVWSQPADLDLIRQSTTAMARLADELGWSNVVIPRPGCGNGGRTWSEVEPILKQQLDARFTIISNDPINPTQPRLPIVIR